MRSGIKAIAALVLLSGCGSDANGADNQNNTAQNAPVQDVVPRIQMPPLPEGYVQLNAEQVANLIRNKTVVMEGMPVLSWIFDYQKLGNIYISSTGGVMPVYNLASYKVISGGYVCIKNINRPIDESSECFCISKKLGVNHYMIAFNKIGSLINDNWYKIKIRISNKKI